MPSSRNRYSRAQARARYRKPKRRSASFGWNVAIVVVVLAGIGVLLLTLNQNSNSGEDDPPQAATGDQVGDHWHTLYAVNVCGEWLDPIPEFEARADNPNVRSGIHTHGDGFIHIHPFASDEEGSNATLGRFWDFAGIELGEDEFSFTSGTAEDPETTAWKNGDECPNGKTGVVRWEVNGEEMTGNPADLKLQDRDCVAIAFLPESRQEIGDPPQVGSSPIDDGSGTGAFPCEGSESSSSTTTVPGASTTVASTPAESTAPTETTSAPSAGSP